MVLGVTPVTGSSAYGIYGWETTFGTVSSSIDKVLGHDLKLSNFRMNRDHEKLTGLGNVEGQKAVAKPFKGTFTADWVMGNSYFWRGLTGNASVDAGSGPYTHTFLNTAGTPATVAKQAPSFSLDNGIDLDNDYRARLLGCKFNSFTLSASNGDPVKCKADIEFADIDKSGVLQSNIADSWADPFTFSHGVLKLPTGTTLSEVLSIELTITRNPDRLVGLGNFKTTKMPNKLIDYGVKASIAFEDPAKVMDYFLGSSSAVTNQPSGTTLDLNFDNGLSTTSSRKHELSFTNVYLPSYSLAQMAEETIKEEMDVMLLNWTLARGTDNTASAL